MSRFKAWTFIAGLFGGGLVATLIYIVSLGYIADSRNLSLSGIPGMLAASVLGIGFLLTGAMAMRHRRS